MIDDVVATESTTTTSTPQERMRKMRAFSLPCNRRRVCQAPRQPTQRQLTTCACAVHQTEGRILREREFVQTIPAYALLVIEQNMERAERA
jgi:hypothetical protein